jgi:hypothetical protein
MNNLLRVKCPNCQKVQDINGITPCQCGFNLEPQQGTVTLYRKGHPAGAMVGAGVYIDGQPFGHIAATEMVTYSLPFGSHNFHVTMGATRKCKDIVVTISPEHPVGYIKSEVKMGFWSNTMILTPSSPAEMPQQ